MGTERQQEPSLIGYRPDIDGLRAIAVIGVVAFHASPNLFSGGFVGVDVFFVISGFLITSIVLRERDKGAFSIVNFYGRRIKRLFPALIVVLAATILMAWFFLLPHEFGDFGKHVVAGSTYFINFVLSDEAGYFDVKADQKPLLHLWSLAVEEQFYIFWPLVLLIFRRPDRLFFALLALTLVSFTANLLMVNNEPTKVFYLPHFRFWELSLGSLFAVASIYVNQDHKEWLRRRLDRVGLSTETFAHLLSGVGLVLILGAALGYSESLAYPGAWAVLPTVGALMIIAAGANGFVNRHVLSWSIVVFVGLISYPLYLWHWPLLSFRSILEVGEQDWIVTTVLVAAAIALSCATYFLIERPYRRRSSRLVPATLMGVTLSLCLAGLLFYSGAIGPRLDEVQYRDIASATKDWAFPDGLERKDDLPGTQIFSSGNDDEDLLLIGDSHVQQYWPRIAHLLDQYDATTPVMFATTGGCPPIPGWGRGDNPNCAEFGKHAFELAKEKNLKTVVIAAFWLSYLRRPNYWLESEDGTRETGTRARSKAFATLAQSMKELTAQGKTVWLVLNVPTSRSLDPNHSLHRSVWGTTSFKPVEVSRAKFDRRYAAIKAGLIDAAAQSGAKVIDPMNSLCDEQVCRGRTNEGKFIFKDGIIYVRVSFVTRQAS